MTIKQPCQAAGTLPAFLKRTARPEEKSSPVRSDSCLVNGLTLPSIAATVMDARCATHGYQARLKPTRSARSIRRVLRKMGATPEQIEAVLHGRRVGE